MRLKLCKLILAILSSLILWAPALWAQHGGNEAKAGEAPEPLRIVTSIRPLALIAGDLLGDLAEVEPLLPPGTSPHDYALRVSDLQRLEQAHLVIWLGPELERFLEKTLRRLSSERVVALNESESSAIDHAHHADPHGWLDPRRAVEYAELIAGAVRRLQPGVAGELDQRLARLRNAYNELENDIADMLAPVRERGFVVYHRGLDLYVARFGLNQVGWISETPERSPGARHLYELEQTLARESAQCLFTDTAHPSASATTLARRFQLRERTLDMAGTAPTLTNYRALMMSLTRAMRACLQES